MHPSLRIRLLTRADLPFADGVRDLAGWNQTIEDWERFLALEPDGCFLAEWEGRPAGTATTIQYGTALAWIGMLLVHPDHRRRGIGRALLERALDHLRDRGVRTVKLDATPLGEPLYASLGFKTEWTLARWSGRVPAPRASLSGAGLRSWGEADLGEIGELDGTVFGVSRRRLLARLRARSVAALVLESAPGTLAGFGLLRPGARALYLGPVVAASDDAGLSLVENLVARSEDRPIFWDIPDPNGAAVAWAERHGFTVQRRLTRMFCGGNLAPGDPRRQFAISGPETG